jgi:hypothetical protein
MTGEEHAIIASIASSALVSFFIPQCDYLHFLHSYFTSSASATTPRETSLDSLEERLTNAMLWNKDSTSQGGSAFPYSASRIRTVGGDNDDGFTTAYFYRFLHQGLSSYLSCGAIFCLNNKTMIMKQAYEDLIQLIAMAISPVTQQNVFESDLDLGPSSLKMSMLPFSFQLSHMDRLQLLRVCKNLSTIPNAASNNDTALRQLRESLFGFASYGAHSGEEAATAYEALANVLINEKDESCTHFEFQRLLQTLMQSNSSFIIKSIGLCLEETILKNKGDKTNLLRVALRSFANCLLEEINNTRDNENIMSSRSTCITENAIKRQKRSPDNCKPFRLVAILKAARIVFSSISSRSEEAAFDSATKQLMKKVPVLLQCSGDNQLDIFQSATEFLACALSHDPSYLSENSNVKHIFTNVRQSLFSVDKSKASSIIDALKSLIITCSRQSGTFAFSFLSFAVKNYATERKLIWKVATYIATGNPIVVTKRLSDFGEGNSDDEEIATFQIRTLLSCGYGKSFDASPSDTMRPCLTVAEIVRSKWVLFKLVRFASQMSNFSFARAILEKHLIRCTTRQQSFMWLNALSKMAHGEEVLARNGAKGITESLELLSSCNSLLTSLSAVEKNGNFNFQLEFVRLRLDTLNLIAITRSLCVEILMTEGASSRKNNRSNLFRKNMEKSFGLLVSRYKKMFRLYGLHRCQQTRSTLRTLISMCQLLSEFAKQALVPESKSSKTFTESTSSSSMPSCDQKQTMSITLSRLRTNVLEKMKQSNEKDDVASRASGFLLVIDAILKCNFPFPSGFFQVKPIHLAIVNISADPDMLSKTLPQNDVHDDIAVDAKSGAEIIDVIPGLANKVILSGMLSEKFIQTANIPITEIIAWERLQYEGPLFEEDYTAEIDGLTLKTLEVPESGGEPTASTYLLPGGKFVISIPFEPLIQEGFYKVTIKLGCRDIRCGEWMVATTSPLEVIFRVDDEGSI